MFFRLKAYLPETVPGKLCYDFFREEYQRLKKAPEDIAAPIIRDLVRDNDTVELIYPNGVTRTISGKEMKENISSSGY